ncbi:MAG: ATP-binding cassette domain-containing protein [Collinsella sp.]
MRQFKSALAPHGNQSGRVLFDGVPSLVCPNASKWPASGFVMQDPDAQIVTDKVWHELAFVLESLGCDERTMRLRVAEMASYFGIQHWFHKNVGELSGGQKQLLNLASVMAARPDVLVAGRAHEPAGSHCRQRLSGHGAPDQSRAGDDGGYERAPAGRGVWADRPRGGAGGGARRRRRSSRGLSRASCIVRAARMALALPAQRHGLLGCGRLPGPPQRGGAVLKQH